MNAGPIRPYIAHDAQIERTEPKLPVQYEQACAALAECSTIDEAKYWDNKADALAAWAKIYKSNRAAIEAKRLKLHAYRRMGQLAEQLRPTNRYSGQGGGHCNAPHIQPGARSLLMENGLSSNQAGAATKLGKMPEDNFQLLASLPRPPAPLAVRTLTAPGTDAWKKFSYSANSPALFRTFCRANEPRELARAMSLDERIVARKAVIEIQEWLDEFETHLRCDPKDSP